MSAMEQRSEILACKSNCKVNSFENNAITRIMRVVVIIILCSNKNLIFKRVVSLETLIMTFFSLLFLFLFQWMCIKNIFLLLKFLVIKKQKFSSKKERKVWAIRCTRSFYQNVLWMGWLPLTHWFCSFFYSSATGNFPFRHAS